MNLAETHDLLMLIAAFDNRRFDDATVMAWQQILAGSTFADCRQAVIQHFGSSEAYLMPVHVRQGAAEVRNRRAEVLARESRRLEIEAPGRRDRSVEVRALIAELRESLPDGDPDKLRYGHRHWRQERERREREARYGPNPHYDPAALSRLAEEAEAS